MKVVKENPSLNYHSIQTQKDAKLMPKKGAQVVQRELVSQHVCLCPRACCSMAYQFWVQHLPWGHQKQTTQDNSLHPQHPVVPPNPFSLWQDDGLVLDVFCLSHLLFPAVEECRELHSPFKTLISSVTGQKDTTQFDSGYRSVVAHCLPNYSHEEPLWTGKFSELTRI